MTKEEFESKLEALRTFDFDYNGTTYVISLERSSGKNPSQKIYFGEQYLPPTEYENFTHLMADCEIGFCYLREIIKSLKI